MSSANFRTSRNGVAVSTAPVLFWISVGSFLISVCVHDLSSFLTPCKLIAQHWSTPPFTPISAQVGARIPIQLPAAPEFYSPLALFVNLYLFDPRKLTLEPRLVSAQQVDGAGKST
jgi:hypothetical protein